MTQTLAANNGQQPQQPKKPPCNGSTRIADVLKAADGLSTTLIMSNLAVGFILGVAASAGVQVVADSSGNLGVAFNFGGNPGYGVFGAGATGGVQGMYSTAGSIYGLRGGSIGAGVSAFNGELDGSIGSGGVVTGTVTAGAGVGTKGAALSLNYTFVPSALSTNCRQ